MGLTKTQTAQVKALVLAPSETKYVAESAIAYNGNVPIVGFGVLPSVIGGGTTSTAWTMIPRLTQGVGGHQRTGNRVSNVTLKTDFQFWLNPSLSNYPTLDYTVKVFCMRAKPIKSNTQVVNLPPGSLLDDGQGGSIDWVAAGAPITDKSLAMYPVNKEIFTPVKVVTFRLAKNADSPTGGTLAGCAPNLVAHQTHNFSCTLKHKGSVVYPDSSIGATIPENLALFCFAVVYDTNAFGNTVIPSAVLCNARQHMWFKDA